MIYVINSVKKIFIIYTNLYYVIKILTNNSFQYQFFSFIVNADSLIKKTQRSIIMWIVLAVAVVWYMNK